MLKCFLVLKRKTMKTIQFLITFVEVHKNRVFSWLTGTYNTKLNTAESV